MIQLCNIGRIREDMDCLKNTLEEIVIQEVEDAFKTHPEVCQCLQCKKDVTASLYSTISNRDTSSPQGGCCTNPPTRPTPPASSRRSGSLYRRGMRRVNEHKRPNFEHDREEGSLLQLMGKTKRFTMTAEYYRNYPFFIGEVRDSATGDSLADVRITLLVDGVVIPGWDGNWPNPYTTSIKSGCKFAFWPKPGLSDNQERISSVPAKFEIKLEKDGYSDRTVRL